MAERDTETIEIDISDAACGPLATDTWRAVLRPMVLEMYYNRITTIKVTRTADRLRCHVEFQLEDPE